MKNHYKTLGIEPSADDAVVKAAFRALAKQTHPDQNPGDPKAAERFQAINEAHEVLKDKRRRAAHDRALAALSGEPSFKKAPTGSVYNGFADFCDAAFDVCTQKCARWSYRSFGHSFETAIVLNAEHFGTGYIPLWISMGVPAAGMALSFSGFVYGHSVFTAKPNGLMRRLVMEPVLDEFQKYMKSKSLTTESFKKAAETAGKRLMPFPLAARAIKAAVGSVFRPSR